MRKGMRIWDFFNLLSKFNFNRSRNAVRVLIGFYLSRLIRRPILNGFPLSVSIEPTTSCNLRCPQCPSGLRSFSRPTGSIDVPFYKQMIDDLCDHVIYLLLYFQGEPFLHPHFSELVAYAHRRNIYTATSTNAHFIDKKMAERILDSGLDRLIISIDGLTQETYQKYRIGGNLDKVKNGIQCLLEAKKYRESKKPFLILQFLVFRFNEHEVALMKDFGRALGISVSFKTAQIYDYQKSSDIIPDDARLSRYKKSEEGDYAIKNKLYNHCWKMWHSSVFTWDGRVVPCCFDKDAKHIMGDLGIDDFKTVWYSKKYRNFRSKVLTERKSIDICKNCSEGTKIWI